jgi:hypothetical protein
MLKAKMAKPSFGSNPQSNSRNTPALLGKRSMQRSTSFRNMKMTYATPGANISPVEVTNISRHGFWVLLNDEELFLPFAEFPWFRDVAIGKILHVELPSPNHLYWPELDVDLAVESIRHPEQFPLISQVGA